MMPGKIFGSATEVETEAEFEVESGSTAVEGGLDADPVRSAVLVGWPAASLAIVESDSVVGLTLGTRLLWAGGMLSATCS